MILFIKEYIKKQKSSLSQTKLDGEEELGEDEEDIAGVVEGVGAAAAGLLAGVSEEESGLVVAAASPWASLFSATICRCWFLREEEKR